MYLFVDCHGQAKSYNKNAVWLDGMQKYSRQEDTL